MAGCGKLLVVLTVLLYNVNQGLGNPLVKAELIKAAVDMVAPFTDTALKRIQGEIFGSGRAARSSDVIIFNTTPKQFRLRSNTCDWGGFSSNLFPEHELKPKTSIVYGIESNGFMAGVTCSVTYEVVDNSGTRTGEYFTVTVDNPYFGHNVEKKSVSGAFDITSTLGQGNNNQVRYILS